ncbi:MAG: glutamyl-tRNA synthetase [Candidatus Tokpelaia sp. JSC189]|nr:MAG: glutamyl-tRNA synthetase [Candidatus Tokpelaia sp. JSC189]
MIRVRFAPSPTGYIHIGNARIALFNWLFAMQKKGKFILRYDDTDIERSKNQYIDGIAEDLEWLGIRSDEVYFQSKRFERYEQIAQQLIKSGFLYPCYETLDELKLRRKVRLSHKLPPVYGREALKLTEKEKQAFKAEGRQPHWRFLLPNFINTPFKPQRTEMHWDDAVRGPQTIDLASISDPVLIRADGTYLYILPSVVDDMDMGMTHIIRGDDHVTNTAVQIAIFRVLGTSVPVFGHINLLTSMSGEGLSKRKGDLSIRSLRKAGIEAMAVASLAVLIGTLENIESYVTMRALAEHFDLSSISKSAARFDPVDLINLNRHIIHELTFVDVNKRLAAMGITGKKVKAFWLAVRGNLDILADAQDWWRIITDFNLHFALSSEIDLCFFNLAADLLPYEPWNRETWQKWIERLKEKSDKRGKSLFRPLRFALTGRESGPKLGDLLPLMGYKLVEQRLKQDDTKRNI